MSVTGLYSKYNNYLVFENTFSLGNPDFIKTFSDYGIIGPSTKRPWSEFPLKEGETNGEHKEKRE